MRSSSVNQIILKTLARGQSHLTAQQIFERVREDLPAVNPSTIYRALERLTRAGQVSVSDMGLGASVYEAVGNHLHHHLVCQACGKVTTLADEPVRTFFGAIDRHHDFKIVTNHLVLFGHCSQCQALLETSSGTG